MTDLRFERIAQIITVAALGSSSDSIAKYYVQSGSLKIRFSEYVKSQVHLNVVHGLFGRQLKEYVETLWFLNGHMVYRDVAKNVLRYFYSDLSDFLVNNCNAIDLSVVVDTNYFGCPSIHVDLEKLREDFQKESSSIVRGDIKLKNWRFAKALDYAKDYEDLKMKAGSYAFAVLLKDYSKSTELVLIESE